MENTSPEEETTNPTSTKVEIHLRGRDYTIVCDPGEEDRLEAILELVEEKLEDVSTRGTNNSEMRMFMLSCLVLADELIETRRMTAEGRKADEELMVTAVNHLRDRIMTIAEKVGEG